MAVKAKQNVFKLRLTRFLFKTTSNKKWPRIAKGITKHRKHEAIV
jgi:hypothetical protein